MTDTTLAAPRQMPAAIGFFEKYLTLWVALCILAGIALGYLMPGFVGAVAQAEVARVNLPVAVLIWLMIVPMLLRVDFRSLAKVGAIPSALIEIDNREATREAVAIGMGISVMSAAEFPGVDNRLVSLAIKDSSLQFTEYVACLKKRRDLRTVREFFRVAGQFAKPSFAIDWPRRDDRMRASLFERRRAEL